MKTYRKCDMIKAGKSIDEILHHIEHLSNCPENKDGELKADCDTLEMLIEKVDTLNTYLNDIQLE